MHRGLLLLSMIVPVALACSDDGPTERIVFASSASYNGNLGGPDGADERCQGLADEAELDGTFMAWVSDSMSSPSQHFTRSRVPYRLVDGTLIAADWADLTDGALDHPIDLNEYGLPAPTGQAICDGESGWVHTATKENGTYHGGASDCAGWTSALGGGTWGRTDETTLWSAKCTGGAPVDLCGKLAPIFCFEQ